MLSDKAREAQKEYSRKYRKSLSPEKKEQIKEEQRIWRRQHPDKVREYNESYWERKALKNSLSSKENDANSENNISSTGGKKMLTDKELEYLISKHGIEKLIFEMHNSQLSLRGIASALKISHMKVKRILDEYKNKL